MTRDEVLECVREVLCKEFDLASEAIVPSARLHEDLDLDSIDLVALVVLLEQETGFVLKEQRLERLRTVHDIVGFVCDLESESASGSLSC